MEFPPPAPTNQDTMLPIVILLNYLKKGIHTRITGHFFGIILQSTTYIYMGHISSPSSTKSTLSIY